MELPVIYFDGADSVSLALQSAMCPSLVRLNPHGRISATMVSGLSLAQQCPRVQTLLTVPQSLSESCCIILLPQIVLPRRNSSPTQRFSKRGRQDRSRPVFFMHVRGSSASLGPRVDPSSYPCCRSSRVPHVGFATAALLRK